MLLVGYSIIVDNWKECGHERYCCGYRCGDIFNYSQLGAVADRAHAEQSCFLSGDHWFTGQYDIAGSKFHCNRRLGGDRVCLLLCTYITNLWSAAASTCLL